MSDTKKVLTPGRWRGLKLTSTLQDMFAILAFDQRGTYRKMLPERASFETAVHIKREIVVRLSEYVSAVLLDAEYGFEPALHMAGHTGLLMALEKSGYSGDSTYRQVAFVDGWTPGKIKQIGASAVKLLTYYNPDAEVLAQETETIIKQVITQCHEQDIPLFLEPLSYSADKNVLTDSAEFAEVRPSKVIDTAKRLSKLNPDVLKLEFPINAAFNNDHSAWQSACESISAVCSVPWVLLSAGVDFETFAQQVSIACRAGASGYLAGRAIWKEAISMDEAARQQFLGVVAVDRLKRLNEIVSREARPWTEYYDPVPTSTEWWVTA